LFNRCPETLGEPFQQAREAIANAIDVERRNFHQFSRNGQLLGSGRAVPSSTLRQLLR
jgi:hypothetical protein